MRTEYFDYQFRFAGQVDIGKSRKSNQDEILVNPELGFFGVSDGMGGLENGAAASAFVKKGLPLLLTKCSENWDKTQTTAEEAGSDLKDCTAALSDHLFSVGSGFYTELPFMSGLKSNLVNYMASLGMEHRNTVCKRFDADDWKQWERVGILAIIEEFYAKTEEKATA